MKKSISKFTLIILVVLLSLTSCSAVFDAAIGGKVEDSAGNALEGVMVYAYFDKNTYEQKISSYKDGTIFTDNSAPSGKSTQTGSFSISTLRWETNNPLYGKDADARTVYLLAFDKDYGLIKGGSYLVQSDKGGSETLIIRTGEKKTETKQLEIKFIDDEKGTAITDTTGFTYSYSYNDGYGIVSGEVNRNATTNAILPINITYLKGNVPDVEIYSIQPGSDWSYVGENNTATIKYDGKAFTGNELKFSKDYNTVAVTITLIDGSSANDSAITTPMSFKYSFTDGKGNNISGTLTTTTTGSVTIPNGVLFKKNSDKPITLTLTNFRSTSGVANDDIWELVELGKKESEVPSKETVTINDDSDTERVNVYFRKSYLVIPAPGINGYIYTPNSSSTSGGIGSPSDNLKKVKLTSADTEYIIGSPSEVWTGSVPASSDSKILNNGHYTGLGINSRFKLTYPTATPYKSSDVTLTLTYETGDTTDKSDTMTVNSLTVNFEHNIEKK